MHRWLLTDFEQVKKLRIHFIDFGQIYSHFTDFGQVKKKIVVFFSAQKCFTLNTWIFTEKKHFIGSILDNKLHNWWILVGKRYKVVLTNLSVLNLLHNLKANFFK